MHKHLGAQTVRFSDPPHIVSGAAVVGPKEGEGPLAEYFDEVSPDVLFGQTSWEKAESEMVRRAVSLAIRKAELKPPDVQYIFSGDLLNQDTGTSYGLRALGRPFFGLFGACSAMGMGMTLGAMMIDGGFAQHVVANASSHFCAAEKTFRLPLELGTQRAPTASWTVTADGAVVLAAKGQGPCVTHATTGLMVDMGITDASNMGAAMAPAAAKVLAQHFADTGRAPDYYDMIVTGDLGQYGQDLLVTLLQEEGHKLEPLPAHHALPPLPKKQGANLIDCGLLIFDRLGQDVHAGGSGCGCCAATFAGYLLAQLNARHINRLLFVPTGALHSTTTLQQGETIPAIAHAVAIENMLPKESEAAI